MNHTNKCYTSASEVLPNGRNGSILLKNSFSVGSEKITAFTGREVCKQQGPPPVTFLDVSR